MASGSFSSTEGQSSVSGENINETVLRVTNPFEDPNRVFVVKNFDTGLVLGVTDNKVCLKALDTSEADIY